MVCDTVQVVTVLTTCVVPYVPNQGFRRGEAKHRHFILRTPCRSRSIPAFSTCERHLHHLEATSRQFVKTSTNSLLHNGGTRPRPVLAPCHRSCCGGNCAYQKITTDHSFQGQPQAVTVLCGIPPPNTREPSRGVIL